MTKFLQAEVEAKPKRNAEVMRAETTTAAGEGATGSNEGKFNNEIFTG